MKIEHMKYYLEISRCKSISEAARNLYIGQTTLSHIVWRTERELGRKMFHRTPSGCELTEDGKRAIPVFCDIVRQYDELIDSMQSENRHNSIRFVTYNSMNIALSPFLSKWVANVESDINLSLQEAKYFDVVSYISQGKARIGIGADIYGSNTWRSEAQKNHLNIEYLNDDQYYAIVRSDSPMAQRGSVRLKDLYSEHLATAQNYPQSFIAPYQRVIDDQSLMRFRKVTTFASNEQMKRAVIENGMVCIGLGIAPYRELQYYTGRVKFIPLLDFDAEITNFLVWDDQYELSHAERDFLNTLREHFHTQTPILI